jgi:hypothetical protein
LIGKLAVAAAAGNDPSIETTQATTGTGEQARAGDNGDWRSRFEEPNLSISVDPRA